MASIHRRARRQFARQAESYVNSLTHARGEDLEMMTSSAAPLAGKTVLDVATGAGHTALAFAREGARVVASDLTPEMLEAAERHVGAQAGESRPAGGEPIEFVVAPAEQLPFADGSFDVVTCRIAAHHFADPRLFLSEAARVLTAGGILLLVDNIAPEDRELAESMNMVEWKRDRSHVEAYPVSRWVHWLARAGFDLLQLRRWRRVKDYRDWLDRSGTDHDAGARLEAEILALPDRHRAYLEVEVTAGRIERLAHEVAFLVALAR